MNHYPKHIGDWMTATAHLSEIEECVYSRMVDQYYAREAPLPLEIGACCRLVRASSAAVRKAVPIVLGEFFTKETDGWHQQRCDEEIAKFREGEGQGQEKREHEAERQRRHRERRRELFATLRDRGIVPAWDAPITELERLCNAHVTQPVTQPVTRTATAIPEPEPEPEPEPLAAQSSTASPTPKSKPLRPPSAKTPSGEAPTAAVWASYSTAYMGRYGVEPVRNAKVNGQMSAFVGRVGETEAPAIAAHYLRSNRGLYVGAKHATDLLLRDAEALRTEWATGTNGTDTDARRTDKTATTANVFNKLIEEARNADR